MATPLTGTRLALMDEYHKAINELIEIIRPLSPGELSQTRDSQTDNPDCRTIQAILAHVVYAGFGYLNYIEKNLGSLEERPQKQLLESAGAYTEALEKVYRKTNDFLITHPAISLEEKENDKKIHTRWGQVYDIEQMLEHAIVHVLKHRRQISRQLQIVPQVS
jgi:uncharacterized damage-inducible protein DinB